MALIKDSEHLRIPFQDIEGATKNFTTLIGKGGYGNVYKGVLLLSGKLTTVAVKRLDPSISGQGFKEFLTEIHLLSRYKHPNLVSLLGFCHERSESILIYEYAEHGSLEKFLTFDTTLTCKQKINICVDAARGMDYLHNHVGENHRVIHRDIKSANILLDHNWKAMISDLGLSKIGRANENDTFVITNACGTHGYCDPAYMDTGVLTKESDVYSFGVVLFEVLCGRLCFMNVNDEQRFLAPLARRYYDKGKLHEIINLVMKEQLNPGCLNRISEITYQCVLNDREKRPSMGVVAMKLKEALRVQDFDGQAMKREEMDIISHPNPIVASQEKVSGEEVVADSWLELGKPGFFKPVPVPVSTVNNQFRFRFRFRFQFVRVKMEQVPLFRFQF
ncbi:hypothetical protein R6Q59_006042 [Mikania micrantha]